MKKSLSLVLALVLVLGSFSTVFAASYNDVTGTAVESAVDRLSLLGILEGYPDGTFKPEAEITRAEFAAVAVRAKGLENAAQAAKGLATGFSDVKADHWASGYVGTAGKLGIVNGVGGGLFAPAAPVKYEEAVTMIVRALGYEAAAQAKGGYPYGYLIVANENGLLDAVKGIQGAAASRGLVAQLTDNALEIPMMVQVGYGSEVKWVVSGSKEHGGDEKYLLDEMGFDTYEGRVTSVNTKRKEITLDNEDEDLKLKDKTVKVAEGFDFYSVEGLTIKAWYSNDKVILHTVKDEAKFDAAEYDEKEKELTLITEDENYEVAKGAYLVLDGKKVTAKEFEADYAKVALNDDKEIVWAEGYTFDGFIVVNEVKDDLIKGYEDDELKVKDFTIVKDGKTLVAKDLEDGDVVFYNNNEDIAVVATISKSGKIDRVYSDSFRFEGKTYKFENAKYFDGKNLNDIGDTDVLDEIVKDADEVEAIFNFANKAVLVTGANKKADASTFYAVLLEDSGLTPGRRGNDFLSIDVRTTDGSKKAYDLDAEFVKKHELGTTVGDDVTVIAKGIKVKGDVIKITVDKDGDPSKVVIVKDSDVIKSDFKVTASYAKGVAGDYKLTPSTVVFYNSNKKAIKIGEIKDEFEQVKKDGIVFYEAGKAVAIVADTNADADTKTVVGLLGTVKELSSGAYEFRVKVAGKSETYVTEKTNYVLPSGIKTGTNNKIVKLEVGEKSGKAVSIKLADNFKDATIKSVNGKVLVADDANKSEYTLSDNYKLYDANDDYSEVRSARDLVGKKVTLYFEGNSKTYVSYVVVGETSKNEDVTGVVTYINTQDKTGFAVDGEIYEINAKTILKDKSGKIIALGLDVANFLKLGDKVEVKDNVITVEVSVVETDAANLLAAKNAVTALETAAGKTLTVEANLIAAEAAVTAAQAAVNKLPADVAPATTKADLQTKINAAKGTVTTARTTFDSANAVSSVIAKIDAIPTTVTLADKATVEAARTAYNKLFSAQTASVTNYAKLTAAEVTIAGLEADASNLAKAKDEVAVAKAALTTLAVTNPTDTTGSIAKPANHANGATYTLALGTLPAFTTGSVSGVDPVAITKDAAAFEFEITVTISSTEGGQTADDTVVFTVTVPNTVAPITVAK